MTHEEELAAAEARGFSAGMAEGRRLERLHQLRERQARFERELEQLAAELEEEQP